MKDVLHVDFIYSSVYTGFRVNEVRFKLFDE